MRKFFVCSEEYLFVVKMIEKIECLKVIWERKPEMRD